MGTAIHVDGRGVMDEGPDIAYREHGDGGEEHEKEGRSNKDDQAEREEENRAGADEHGAAGGFAADERAAQRQQQVPSGGGDEPHAIGGDDRLRADGGGRPVLYDQLGKQKYEHIERVVCPVEDGDVYLRPRRRYAFIHFFITSPVRLIYLRRTLSILQL